MATLSPGRRRLHGDVEGAITLAAPALDLLLAVGDEVPRGTA